MIKQDGKLYIGREAASAGAKQTDPELYYDSEDLMTHAVVVGMTGSGKTGLCIDILEEAALQGIPSIMIDPKGDITNTLLHFPGLLPEDFAPWLNAEQVRKEGKTVAEAAQETADLWRNGLADWGIDGERIQALKDSAQFAVYTPGSDAGTPISIVNSLAAPALPWDENTEVLREQISSTVTALLGLIGLEEIDPVTSREHILMATIFENAWSQGRDLTLEELIMQSQSPPFTKMGFLETDVFYPAAERFKLAAKFNALVAAPSFKAWLAGEPLDIDNLLYTSDGRPRHSVFYIAHLSDEERMFIVTLLFSIIETWMRSQSGTTSLRALIYFDEISGYLPPSKKPSSKEPMLRMLKQARAFGVGLLLATQNPVDVDYKGLSNAGTWFIGRLSTAKDKERLLDGLAGAGGGALDVQTLSKQISSLGKRVFLLRNVHDSEPQMFQTRWAMNYLAGPMTRLQIPALNELAGAEAIKQERKDAKPQPKPGGTAVSSLVSDSLPGTTTKPPAPAKIQETYLPVALSLAQAARAKGSSLPVDAREEAVLYVPALFARAIVRYDSSKYQVQHDKQVTAFVPEIDPRDILRWEDHLLEEVDHRDFSARAERDARYAALEAPLSDSAALRSLQADFEDWVYREAAIPVKVNEDLGLYAGPGVSEADFRKQCIEAAEDEQEKEVDKLEAAYEKKIKSLQDKLTKEQRELREDEQELARRKQNEYASYGETLLSWFGGRRRSVSSSLSKRDMRARAEEDVEESIEAIKDLEEDLAELHQEMEAELLAIEERWTAVALDISETQLTPYKKDIKTDFFGIAWSPSYLVATESGFEQLPANQLDQG
jgi:hypothetical protein